MALSLTYLCDVRLLLEFVEVPCISAVVQIVPNQPTLFTFQVVSTEALFKLPERTLFHAFFQYKSDREAWSENLEDYHHLGHGELRQLQLSKQVGSRSAFLVGEDVSAYWDQTLQYVGNYGSGGDGFWDRTSAFFGSNTKLFDNILRSPENVVSNLISKKSVSRPNAKGLMGGVLRLLEQVGGVSAAQQKGLNDFLTAAELRLRIIDQLGVIENDETSQRILEKSSFERFITNTQGSYGTMLSFRDLLQVIFQFLFFSVVPNPMGRYLPNPPQPTTKPTSISNAERESLEKINNALSACIHLLSGGT